MHCDTCTIMPRLLLECSLSAMLGLFEHFLKRGNIVAMR
jgi:hypothetical protein